MLAGVVLGEDEGLDQELRDRFRASGLYHLLAVSGQNVAYVVAGMILLAWTLGFPRWIGEVGALGAVFAYVLAVGWQPSVVRAGVAGGLASLAWLASRPRDRWYFLLVGAAVLLAWNPYSLLEPGFQLSFAAVAAIFVLVPRIEAGWRATRCPSSSPRSWPLSAACGAATAPILWLHFGAIPVYSLVRQRARSAGRRAAPRPRARGRGSAPGPAGGRCRSRLDRRLAGGVSRLLRADGRRPSVRAGRVRRACSASSAAPASSPRSCGCAGPGPRRAAAVAGVVLALVVAWRSVPGDDAPPLPNGLRITVLDVGQGDAILLQVPEGAVLVDQGPPEADVAGQLDDLGVERLVALVLTHPQRDHVGGAADVLGAIEVGAVLDPRIPAESEDHERRARGARERTTCRSSRLRAGQRLRVGALRLEVLWPDGARPAGRRSERPCGRPPRDLRTDRRAPDGGRGGKRHGPHPAAAGRDPQGRAPRLGGHVRCRPCSTSSTRRSRSSRSARTTTTVTRRPPRWPR